MKKCQTCGNQNADDMRFCLNCGSSLPDAPVIVNFGGAQQGGGSNPGTNPYGQSMETQFGKPQQPQFQPPQQQQQSYSMVPPSKRGGGKKILIAAAGVFFLLFLIVVAIGGIFAYNMMKSKPQQIATTSPTPSASPSASTSPSASPSASKSSTPKPTPSETPDKTSGDQSATFEKAWVDYNIKEGGENGMRIHVKFDVHNMEGVDCYLIVYFQEEDGTNLTTSDPTYGSSDGRVAVKKLLTPGYKDTTYKDLTVFMPYSELNLTKGKYNLKMDIDVAGKDETLIQHLGYHEFEYEKF